MKVVAIPYLSPPPAPPSNTDLSVSSLKAESHTSLDGADEAWEIEKGKRPAGPTFCFIKPNHSVKRIRESIRRRALVLMPSIKAGKFLPQDACSSECTQGSSPQGQCAHFLKCTDLRWSCYFQPAVKIKILHYDHHGHCFRSWIMTLL